ncbi:hypothetical protein E4U35_004617 [Claviceps purpurea]|nr:hypothetical protein E4U35_004617 [Claviceps purpurea]
MEPKCFSELRVYWNDVSIRNSPLRPPVNFGVKGRVTTHFNRHVYKRSSLCIINLPWALFYSFYKIITHCVKEHQDTTHKMLIQIFGAVLFAAFVGAAPQHQLEARTHGVSVEKVSSIWIES